MENNNLDNKLLKDLNKGIVSVSESLGKSIEESKNAITKEMTKNQKIQADAYLNKYLKLKADGKHDEADQLSKDYIEQF